MIISASRRTDIPAFYSQWFFNRIKEGYVLVPNPYHPKMISRISLSPAVVDCFVFWTKNPAPMLNQLDKLQDYNYYFQFTLNPYGEKLENRLPSIDKRIDTFKKLADKIGREKMIWRYDPILTNEEYNVSFHQEAFARIAHELKDHTSKCMLGFIDHYPHIRNSIQPFNINPLTKEEIEEMAVSFKKTIDIYPGIQLDTCTVKVDLRHLGIPSGLCIDKGLIEKITGYPILAQKDKNGSVVILGGLSLVNSLHAYTFASLKRKKLISTTPLNDALNALILALNASAAAFVLLFTKKFRILS
ncbi:protein of unknown function (DUF1848) [Bacteroides xylanisolvens]|uniref:DUF1848 domain-containing protein n=1 Tax=Bacteroides xylanisolvens TaxID=371601 RepID=UPI001BEE30B9|nr:protein of unknown function (DUF1848) [Bacteroides xylanisolvens]